MEAMDTSSPDPLLEEFNTWAKDQKINIELKEFSKDEDGKVSIKFVIDKGQEFVLHCPLHYPNYQDDNFFVEADPSLQLWCNALNEFLLDSGEQLSLTCILNKGVSLYSSADSICTSAGEDEEDEDDDMEEDICGSDDDNNDVIPDEQLDDMLDQDLNWELEVARRKKKWKMKEEELRSITNGSISNGVDGSKSLQQLYHDPNMKNRRPKEVFSSDGSSGILTNDLVSIMEASQTLGIQADTVDDNIFQWNVKLSDFNEFLKEDFTALKEMHGYDYIQLQLDFSMDLYPFYPPLVKVIRPRLQGAMMLRVTTMEILKLTYWDPARDMKSVLTDIKNFLNTWARLDLTSERNDMNRYPDGAYIDIEHHLLRLALVSEITPRANKKYVTAVPPPANLPSSAVVSPGTHQEKKDDKKNKPAKIFGWNIHVPGSSGSTSKADKKKKEDQPAKNMAKGVGYSNYQHKGWDVKAYMAAQNEKDKQIQLVLDKIFAELKKLHTSHQAVSRNLPDLLEGAAVGGAGLPPVDVDGGGANGRINRGSSRRKRKHSPDDVAQADSSGNSSTAGPVDPLSDLYAVLEGSALVPFLESKLQANSFLEIGRHSAVYRVVIGITREISSQPCLVSLLGSLPDQKSSLHSLLQGLESQARILIERIGKASANGSVPKPDKVGRPEPKPLNSDQSGDALARDFLNLSKEVTVALKHTGYLPDINGEGSSADSRESPEPVAGTSGHGEKQKMPTQKDIWAEQYTTVMRDLQFDSIEFSQTGRDAHFFQADFTKAGTPSSQIIFRVAQEISSLAAPGSLPVNFSSSIFVRSDDDKSTLLRGIITGPEDTPYTGGCFLFDIYFPAKYPSVPPKVNFRTTGNGQVRFNPNLYNCGKVCLSLLGTWEGAQGEQWNAETSTILQVLVSIQSLILCPEPYYNEPGYERHYGTSVGNTESNKYNEDVLRNNLKYAILGQLSQPPEGFQDIVLAHFYLKRHSLISELEAMMETYKSKDVKKLVADVKRELLKMEQPSIVKTPN